MIENNKQYEELCQLESQKSIVKQMILPIYQQNFLRLNGPKLELIQAMPSKQTNDNQDIPYPDTERDNGRQLEQVQQNTGIQFTQAKSVLIQSDANVELISIGVQQEQQDQVKGENQSDSYLSSEIMKQICQIEEMRKQYAQQLNQEIDEETQECKICMGDVPINQIVCTLECKHCFCLDCQKQYLIESIRRCEVLEIKCPQAGCQQTFSDEQIRQGLNDKAMFIKYRKFYEREKIGLNKNVRWCPKPDCENYVIGEGSNKLQCKCGQLICFECGKQYHEGLGCMEAEDQAYILARKLHNIHDCPRCRAPIQKRSGCNHMTCYKCHYQFCWLCGGKYSSYHYVVFNIFGCVLPGGQGMSIEPFNHPLLLRIMMIIPKLILTLLVIVGLLIILPFILIYLILKTPYMILKNTCGIKVSSYLRYDGSRYILMCLLLLFLGIILSPITTAVYIIISPCFLFYYIRELF